MPRPPGSYECETKLVGRKRASPVNTTSRAHRNSPLDLVMALQDTLKVEISREHWDRVSPVFCVFLTHWDCIYFTKFS